MSETKPNYAIPLAIVIAGILIAGAVYYKDANPSFPVVENTTAEVAAVTKDDHIRGSLDAKVKIIDYSDTECPFCKRFHETMIEVMKDYDQNQVAWVYRHFPLDSLHAKARKEAEATECAAELGGKAKFWEYTDKIYEITPSNDGLDLALLPKIAKDIGLNEEAFKTCLNSGKYAAKIESQYQSAIKAGGQGTPFPIVIGPKGEQVALPGAVPADQVKAAIDSLLK